MADAAAVLDAATRAALDQLADIVVPPPPSWWPQTWGWAALGAVFLALVVRTIVRRRRVREANRYRAEALAELAQLEEQLGGDRVHDPAARAAALRALPPLLKRVALAAWPRSRVAALTQARWVELLRTSAPVALPDAAARLLDDLEYRSPQALATLTGDDARSCFQAARQWIEGHRVPA